MPKPAEIEQEEQAQATRRSIVKAWESQKAICQPGRVRPLKVSSGQGSGCLEGRGFPTPLKRVDSAHGKRICWGLGRQM